MEMSPFIIYLFCVCDGLKTLFATGLGISAVTTFSAFVLFIDDGENSLCKEARDRAYKAFKVAIVFVAMFGLLMSFTPSQSNLASIIVIPKVVKGEPVPEIIIEYINDWKKETPNQKH